ncbi:MAG: hypothetical protein Q4E34_05950 [Synergistaceae bacterium]|nr:hypothetical protein [Synergistaceae bacterium]
MTDDKKEINATIDTTPSTIDIEVNGLLAINIESGVVGSSSENKFLVTIRKQDNSGIYQVRFEEWL